MSAFDAGRIVAAIGDLSASLTAYTDAVNRQTEMLTTILQALAEQEMGDDDDLQPITYLDGTPR